MPAKLRPAAISAEALDQLRTFLTQSQGLNTVTLPQEDHFMRRNAYYHSGDYQKATNRYTETLSLPSDNPETYHNRGLANGRLEKYQNSISDFTKTLSLRQHFHEAYYNRGVSYTHFRQSEKALADFNEAVRLCPEDTHVYYNLDCMYSLQHDIEPYVANLERAIKLDEINRELWQSDDHLEWVRQDEKVKKLLSLE
jgi:tetratricopeptide (TPR) repeat protein